MTNITLTINDLQHISLFESLARALNVPFEKVKFDGSLSKSMRKALEDERKGKVTKIRNHRNAVAEILG